jgi:hypothetical protein
METLRSSETTQNLYQTTQRHVPEDNSPIRLICCLFNVVVNMSEFVAVVREIIIN